MSRTLTSRWVGGWVGGVLGWWLVATAAGQCCLQGGADCQSGGSSSCRASSNQLCQRPSPRLAACPCPTPRAVHRSAARAAAHGAVRQHRHTGRLLLSRLQARLRATKRPPRNGCRTTAIKCIALSTPRFMHPLTLTLTLSHSHSHTNNTSAFHAPTPPRLPPMPRVVGAPHAASCTYCYGNPSLPSYSSCALQQGPRPRPDAIFKQPPSPQCVPPTQPD